MEDPGTWSLPVSVGVFAGGALLTTLLGVRLSRAGDELADRTGLGEAVFGSVLFGGMISLSGIVMTATAALGGHASLAYSNAVGGVAAQLLVIAIADFAYRKANLEHASASLPNAMNAVMLACLLCVVLLASHVPEFTIAGVNLFSFVLLGLYLFGVRQLQAVRREPQWEPAQTKETVRDEPDERSGRSTAGLWADFVSSGLAVSASGWAIARAAVSIVERAGLDASFVGAVLMGAVNAIPETVTAIAAVRTGAVTLAVSGVLGGNAFDVLNVAVGDATYRSGSLYHAAEQDDLAVTITSLLMTLVVLAGMIRRERRGPLGIGTEGVALGVIYACMVLFTAL